MRCGGVLAQVYLYARTALLGTQQVPTGHKCLVTKHIAGVNSNAWFNATAAFAGPTRYHQQSQGKGARANDQGYQFVHFTIMHVHPDNKVLLALCAACTL